MTSDSVVQAPSSERPAAVVDDLDRTVDWRRLVWAGHGVAVLALCAMVFGAVLQAISPQPGPRAPDMKPRNC